MAIYVSSWFTLKNLSISCLILLFISLLYYSFSDISPNNREYENDRLKFIKFAESLPNVPQQIIESKSSIKTHDSFVQVHVKGKTIVTKVVEARPLTQGRVEVFLFLHGMSFSSVTWVKEESLQLVAALGHRAIAVDLPGWGESGEKPSEDEVKNRDYLESLIRTLKITRPIIVTPSMSGAYSMPLMMEPDPSSCHDRLSGLIAIAPIRTNHFVHSEYFRCQIPAMIVYGSLDTKLGLEALGNLRNMPNKMMFIIMGAGHPAYLDKPAQWNKLLYHYCDHLLKKI